MPGSCPEVARSLERLLLRIHALGGQLLSMDGYERWGGGSDPAMNALLADGGRVRADHERAVAELEALLAHARRTEPAAVTYWAEAHERLLAHFLETMTDGTARFVAEEERTAWRALREGTGPLVRENVYYVHVDRALHRALFGDLAPDR